MKNDDEKIVGVVPLLPCPFCGGAVKLEVAERTLNRIMGERRWWGVVCRNTINVGGTCAIQQRPSASEEAAISRWNMRDGKLNSVLPEPEGTDNQ